MGKNTGGAGLPFYVIEVSPSGSTWWSGPFNDSTGYHGDLRHWTNGTVSIDNCANADPLCTSSSGSGTGTYSVIHS